jgi:hypothetical protein
VNGGRVGPALKFKRYPSPRGPHVGRGMSRGRGFRN